MFAADSEDSSAGAEATSSPVQHSHDSRSPSPENLCLPKNGGPHSSPAYPHSPSKAATPFSSGFPSPNTLQQSALFQQQQQQYQVSHSHFVIRLF